MKSIVPSQTIKQRLFEFMLSEFPDSMKYKTYDSRLEIVIEDGIISFEMPINQELLSNLIEEIREEVLKKYGVELYVSQFDKYGDCMMAGETLSFTFDVTNVGNKITYFSVDMTNSKGVRKEVERIINGAIKNWFNRA